MNMPSHHQSALFREIHNTDGIDLRVCYYNSITEKRIKLGWDKNTNLEWEYDIFELNSIDSLIVDWKERIHVVPGLSSDFTKNLVNKLCSNNVKWIHWSEKSGVNFSRILGFNPILTKILKPLFFFYKGYYSYGQSINRNAIGAFAIGNSAKKDFYRWGVRPTKIRVVPYALDPLSHNAPPDFLSKKEFIEFLYVGSLEKRKGISLLLRAFSQLEHRESKIKLRLVGKDYSSGRYKDLAKKLGVLEQVDFDGVIQSKFINQVISNSDVFILPTLFDGWGAVLNEATSLGKPIISTREAGASEHLVESGVNGYIIDSGSVEQLRIAMQSYIDNPNLIDEHGKYSLKIYKNIAPSNVASLFIKSVRELII